MSSIDADSANKVTQFLTDADIHCYLQTSSAAAGYVRRYPRESVFRITDRSRVSMYSDYRNIEVVDIIEIIPFGFIFIKPKSIKCEWATQAFKDINLAMLTTMAFTVQIVGNANLFVNVYMGYQFENLPIFPNVTSLSVTNWYGFSNFDSFPATTMLRTCPIDKGIKPVNLPNLKKLNITKVYQHTSMNIVYNLITPPLWTSVEEIASVYNIPPGYVNLIHITVDCICYIPDDALQLRTVTVSSQYWPHYHRRSTIVTTVYDKTGTTIVVNLHGFRQLELVDITNGLPFDAKYIFHCPDHVKIVPNTCVREN